MNGSYQFVLKADLLNGAPPATHAYSLVIGNAIAIQTPPAAIGEVGVPFARTLTATGGTGTYTWSVSSGSLPAGVTLDVANGTLHGAPQSRGSYTFTAGGRFIPRDGRGSRRLGAKSRKAVVLRVTGKS